MASSRILTPQIRLSNPVVEFMDNRLDNGFHPSLPNPDIQYDPKFDNYRPREAVTQGQIYREAIEERDAFFAAMQVYRDEDREDSRNNLGVTTKAEWEELLDVANRAQYDADVNAIKGASGAIRNLTRKLGESGPAFKGWLQMLPEDAYGSIICGGFTIIIDAAIRQRELCQEVFNALGEIPEVIRGAEFSFIEYKSEELHKRVAKLYQAITETLHGILDFYKERAPGRHKRGFRNAFKAITKGPNYGQDIELNLNLVKDRANAVKQEADRCMHRRVGDIQNAQEYQNLQAAQIKNTGAESLNIMQKIYADLQYRFKCQELQWKENNNALRAEVMDLKRAVTPTHIPKHGPSPRKIYQLMSTSPNIVSQDMEEVLRDAQRFSAGLQTQAGEFMGSPKLQSWLTSPYSCNLFAQGGSGDEKASPLSFVASLISQSLDVSQEAISLSFYCGLHTDAHRDILSDAQGMLRSLVAQLLSKKPHDFDFEFIDRKFIQALETGDLGALCDLFEGLVNQIPPSAALFLTIDGISFYETKDRVQTTCAIMSRIIDIADRSRFVFKLLVTSPGASKYVSQGFTKDQFLWLPDVDPEEDDAFEYNVGVFKEMASDQASMSQKSVMRTNSELREGF
ncbi:MAG: hypothetical protein Q9167_007909 [Letrouitia subvulpina]